MMKQRIYTVLLVGATLFFLSVPMPAMATSWHHHRSHGHHHRHHGHHGPRPGVHFGIFLGVPVVTSYYAHGHALHVHDSRCPVVVEQRVPVYVHPAPTWHIHR
jgi:hypothetical protein